ncbi:hypothetical protein KIPB_012689, partial [Kipferlia bialata]|eukprot:g12689.t1
MESTIASIMDYTEIQVFVDILHDPPAPYEHLAVDLPAAVTAVGETPFLSDYDFHVALTDVFNGLKDPHSVFAIPSCYRQFEFSLPIAFRSEYNEAAGQQYIYAAELPHAYGFVAEQYRSQHPETDLDALLGKRILYIDGVDPVTAIAQFAEDTVYYSKNPHARFNRALNNDYWHRGIKYYSHPTATQIVIETEDTHAFIIEWNAWSKVPIRSNSDLSVLCGNPAEIAESQEPMHMSHPNAVF